MKEEVRQLIAEILEIDSKEIGEDVDFIQDLGIDSLMAYEILAGIEKKYQIVVPEDMIVRLTSLDSTVEIVSNVLKGK